MRRKFILEGHKGNVSSIAFSGIGMLASGSWDKTIRVWDPRKGLLIFLLKGHFGRIMALSFSMDSILLVTGSEDETIRMWDCEDGKCKKILMCDLDFISTCQISPNSTLLVAGTTGSFLAAGSTTSVLHQEVSDVNVKRQMI
ncbi:WD repeat-containing protein 38 [Rhincodon typus]|uniref:WD repeat-containing protein 38 n=1 Tax=Rhincodon typus TaxID=259920 RepID=UPI00202F6AB5|nr:WD repeat-containing protein 38 [Rhincodon typus]